MIYSSDLPSSRTTTATQVCRSDVPWYSASVSPFSKSPLRAAPREADRTQLRHLLDQSILKMHAGNLPLRKSLLVFNTMKSLQQELESLSVEDMCNSLFENEEMEVEDPRFFASNPTPPKDETDQMTNTSWAQWANSSSLHVPQDPIIGGSRASTASLDWTSCPEPWLQPPSFSLSSSDCSNLNEESLGWSIMGGDGFTSWNPLGQSTLNPRDLLGILSSQPLEVLMQA